MAEWPEGFVTRAEALRISVSDLVRRGASVTGLARRCGVSQPQMSNWLAGRRGMSLVALDAVAAVLRPGAPDLPRPVLHRRPWRKRRAPSELVGDF